MSSPVLRILLIDDSWEDRAAAKAALLRGSTSRFEFHEASSCAEGSKLLNDSGLQPFACVVLDYNLPDCEAPEFLESIPRIEGVVAVPVLVLTGSSTDKNKSVLRAGAQEYLGKSWLTPESINRAVENAMDRHAMAVQMVRAHNRIRESEELSRAIVEASPDCIKVLDLEGRLLSINRSGIVILELDSAEAVLGEGWGKRWPAEFSTSMHHAIAEARQGRTHRFQGFCPTAKGTPRWWDVIISPVLNEHGKVQTLLAVSRDITAAKESVEQLRESEARFRNMAEHSPVMMWITDPSGYCNYLNRSWYEYTGQSPEAGLGFGWLDAVHPDDREEAGRIFNEANARQAPFRAEYRLRRHDGTYIWTLDAASPRFSDNTYLGYVGSVVDIHEQKTAEERIRFLSALTATLSTLSEPNDVVATASRKVGEFFSTNYCFFARWNEEHRTVTVENGWSHSKPVARKEFSFDQIQGPVWLELLKDQNSVASDATSVAHAGALFRGLGIPDAASFAVARLARFGNDWITLFLVHDRPRSWNADEALLLERVTSRVWPLVERAKREEFLQEQYHVADLRADIHAALAANDTLDVLLRHCAEAFVRRLNVSSVRISLFDSARRELPCGKTEIVRSSPDSTRPDLRIGDLAMQRIAERKTSLLVPVVESQSELCDPTWNVLPKAPSLAGYPLISEGRVLGVLALISEKRISTSIFKELEPLADLIALWILRKEAERRAREVSNRLEIVIEASLVGFWFCDLPFDELIWDNKVKEHFWLPPHAVVTIQTFYDRIHPEDRERTRKAIARSIETKSTYNIDYRTVSLTGEIKWIKATGRGYYNEAGEPQRFDGVTLDITEMVQARETLKAHRTELEQLVSERTAKLQETIGELESVSYSLSHDMRQPLRSMQQFSQIIVEDYADKLDDMGRSYLNRIINAANRLDRLIQDVLTFSRIARVQIRPEAINLHQLVSDIVNQYPMFHANEADIVIKGRLLPVYAAEAPLTQIISNLLGNAVKFVPQGRRPHIEIATEQRGDQVRIIISDNGIGIPEEQISRIWRMFERATTNPNYDGTGIGLSIVKKAAERMDGTTGVVSRPGEGSSFWVQLPQVPRSL